MAPEDIMKIETGWGKGILGFVLKKFLEGKFGVKFEDFSVPQFKIYTSADGRNCNFHIEIKGEVNKADIIGLLKKGDNK